MSSYYLDHLQYLETEAIHVMREVAAEFERPALLFSGGKDSICLLRLAEKAFRPSELPMPFLNIDTGHHFPELNEFRDRRARELGAKLIVRTVDEAIEKGIAVLSPGQISRNHLQIPTLLAAIEEFRFDCCIGGARRDEEKARAKERFFSFRDCFGQWDPKNQRPEIWNLYNARINPGENMRVFPSQQLDRNGCVGIRPQGEAGGAENLLQSRARTLCATKWTSGFPSMLSYPPNPVNGVEESRRPRPHHRRHHQHRHVLSRPQTMSTTSSPKLPSRASRNAAHAPTTRPAKPRWKTARRSATFECDDRPAASSRRFAALQHLRLGG